MRVSSDDDAETRAFPPLIRHSDVTSRIIIEQITVMDDPGFQNSAKTACLFSLIFYLSKVSVIKIGSGKMLVVMLVSIKRVS